MNHPIDIHQVFANYFKNDIIEPIAYTCSKKLSDGHICFDLNEYNRQQEKKIKITELLKSKWITDKENVTKAFVIKNNKIYMHRYFSYETEIIKSIEQLISNEKSESQKKILLKEAI